MRSPVRLSLCQECETKSQIWEIPCVKNMLCSPSPWFSTGPYRTSLGKILFKPDLGKLLPKSGDMMDVHSFSDIVRAGNAYSIDFNATCVSVVQDSCLSRCPVCTHSPSSLFSL